MTSSEQNAATVCRVLEAINARNWDAFTELVAPGFLRHDYNGISIHREGPEGMAELAHMLLGALPDLHLEVRDIFATEDRAVAYLTALGTHSGVFFGTCPSGQTVSFDSVDLYRLEGGKIAEAWPWPDLEGIRRQMAVPAG